MGHPASRTATVVLALLLAPASLAVGPPEAGRYAEGGDRVQGVDPPDAALAVVRPEAIRAHMRFLADDLLEGRGTGTRGYDLAARYVAAQFEELGLEPAGQDGSYYQPVPLRAITLDAERTWLEVVRDGTAERLSIGQDFLTTGHPVDADAEGGGEVVFVGYGVTAPALDHDDYAKVDVRGKVVAMFANAPPRFPSAERAHFAEVVYKAANAARHGAVGVLTLWSADAEQRIPWQVLARILREPAHRWLDPQGVPNDAHPELRVAAAVGVERSRALFAGATKTYEQALADAAANRAQAFPLPVSVRMRRVSTHESLQSANVVAKRAGTDPSLRDEHVVYTAHLDHEGIGEPRDGDAIYNGALDNASGVAQMLEAARAFARLPRPPRRSILFVAVTAEEHGLLGSDYFVSVPPVPRESIVANVNIDGGLILFQGDAVAHGADHSSLGPVVSAAAKRVGVQVSPDPMPDANFFVRSDQFSFVKKGIPAVFLFPGVTASSASVDGKARFMEYLQTRYHTPRDDMSQSFSFEAGATGARLNFLIGYQVAQQDGRPRWNEGDFFGRAFAGSR